MIWTEREKQMRGCQILEVKHSFTLPPSSLRVVFPNKCLRVNLYPSRSEFGRNFAGFEVSHPPMHKINQEKKFP